MYATYMSPRILVTAALGNVGGHTVDRLLAAGVTVRAADVDATAVAARFGAAVESVALDFTDRATWAAYDDVDAMLVVRPPALSNVRRDMVPSLEAARRAGVGHMVLLSLQGADRNRVVPHAKLESWLRDEGPPWTFVRPSFFMENLSTTHRRDIADLGEIVVPAGGGRTAFVAAADVAAVAAAALLDPGAHQGKAWTPTGPDALTYAQVAGILSDVLRREVRYARPGVLRYARHARSTLGMPWPMVGVTSAIYTVSRLGLAGGLTDDVAAVTGRAPVSFQDWARDRAAVWS
jgi:uncharacterized protein YbjT (DUF2867 family)